MKISKLAAYKKKELRSQLIEVVEKLGYTVIVDKGDFSNGSCKVYDDRRVVINRFLPVDVHIEFLLNFLKSCDLEGIYILPSIRKLIEEHDR
ncbi:MAG: hypothetical protein DRP91_08795 [Candidatus Neomarinimicrobiota bacterium]|nr:hypothetical protein [Candidatus Neomarinimicrobiota bacterium]RKY46699.1 MAG: hypothetical protein DRP91_08795 [Candidatus Neomarinimicrobiota bacterium]